MTSTPPDAPTDEGPRPDPGASGPRVTGDEIRDLGLLRRTRDNRRIAGVAGGLARHFDVDPVIVRVALVVLAFFGGAGLLIYGACWLIVPADGATDATVRLDSRSRTVALVLVGALAVLAVLGDGLGRFGVPWPLFVIGAIVLGVLLVRRHDDDPLLGPFRRTTSAAGPAAAPAAGSAGPAAATGTTQGLTTTYAPVPVPVRRRGGPVLFWYALALVAIGGGVLGSVDLAGADVPDSAYPALALGVSGATLLVGAFWGRAGGVILLGLVSAAATAATTAATEVDAGHVDVRPLTAAAVRSDYQLDAGEIELDLTDVADLEALDGRTIDLDVDLGRIAVILPRGLTVTVDSEVSLGHRTILGDESDGDSGSTTLPGVAVDSAAAPEITLDVSVGVGEITVTREGATR